MTPSTDPVSLLLEARKRHVLTYREISNAINMTEKSVWALCTNGAKPREETRRKIVRYVHELDAKAEDEAGKKIEQYEKVILDILYDEGGTFFATPKPGERYAEGTYPTGAVRKDIWFQDVVDACGVIGNDGLLLDALNRMAQTGVIKILNIWIPIRRPMKSGEGIAVKFETGTALREIPAQDVAFQMTRSYRDEPLDEAEMIPNAIRNPKEVVEKIRRQRQASAKAMWGDSGIESEIREHRERVEDEADRALSPRQLFEILRGGKNMANDPTGSEYDTLLSPRVKTKKIIEIKRINNTKAPQVFYQHDGSRLTIEPGESGIQTQLVRIKPMKAEDADAKK